MTRALTASTRIITNKGAIRVSDIQNRSDVKVYDAWGRASQIKSRPHDKEQKIVTVTLDTGNTIGVGEEHQFYVAPWGASRAKFTPLNDIKEPVCFFIPTRKLRLSDGTEPLVEDTLVNIFDGAKESDRTDMLFSTLDTRVEGEPFPKDARSNLYLSPKNYLEFTKLLELASMYGVIARPHLSGGYIDLDENRPSCFASKLFVGHNAKPETFLQMLYDDRLITPIAQWDQYVKLCIESGIVLEGENPRDLRIMFPPLNTNHIAQVWDVELHGDCQTIEIATMRT